MAERRFQMKHALMNHPTEAGLIGNIIARWNVIERMLGDLFAQLTGTDAWQAKLILASLLSSRSRLDVVKAAGDYALHFGDLESNFDDLMVDLGKRLDARNYYAHGVYGMEGDRLVIMTSGFDWTELEQKKWTQKIRQPVSVTALEQEHQAALASYQSVSRFIGRLAATAPTLGEMQIPSHAFLRRAAERNRRGLPAEEAETSTDSDKQA